MYSVPVADDTLERTLNLNRAGRLTPEQIKRVRLVGSNALLWRYGVVLPFIVTGSNGIDTVETRLEAFSGQRGEILSTVWLALVFLAILVFIVLLIRTIRLHWR